MPLGLKNSVRVDKDNDEATTLKLRYLARYKPKMDPGKVETYYY